MTQTPQSNDSPDASGQRPEGEAPERSFEAILPSRAPKKVSRKPLVILGAAVVMAVAGLIFCSGEPDPAKAKTPKLDYGSMTAEALAKNASARAARELARRMSSGTPAERASASSAVNCWSSPRLVRNLAVAMALEQQKKQQYMMRRMEANRRMYEGGPYRGMRNGRPVYGTRPLPDDR